MGPLTEGDCYAAFYWRDPGVELPFLERLAQSYGLAKGLRVLDVGCGTGRLLPSLSSLGWEVVGMEPHPDYLAMSRVVAGDAPGRVEVVSGGFGDLDAVNRFDLVLAVGDPWWYLLTAEDRADALARSYRALRPGGVIFLDGPNLDWILDHYRPPVPSEVRYGEVRIRRSPQHEIDRDQRVWTHIDTFTAPETGEVLTTVHRFAMISMDEISVALDDAGFGDLRTYASWQAHSPGPPEGPRMMIAAAR